MLIEELIEGNKHWLVILTIPGALLFATLMVYLMHRMMRGKLEPLAMALGGETVVSLWKGAYVRLLSYGAEIRIGLKSGGQNSPPYLTIQQMIPLGFDLTISSENIATRKMEKWGLLKGIKVGDPLFDDNYLIRSSDEFRAQNFLMDSTWRDAVNHFFNNGFSEIIAKKDSVTIKKAGYKKEDLDTELMRSHLEELQKLVSE